MPFWQGWFKFVRHTDVYRQNCKWQLSQQIASLARISGDSYWPKTWPPCFFHGSLLPCWPLQGKHRRGQCCFRLFTMNQFDGRADYNTVEPACEVHGRTIFLDVGSIFSWSLSESAILSYNHGCKSSPLARSTVFGQNAVLTSGLLCIAKVWETLKSP